VSDSSGALENRKPLPPDCAGTALPASAAYWRKLKGKVEGWNVPADGPLSWT